MGRPDPCILFAQSFVHPRLDEYVDEVIFNEPVVVTACEILEQNASPSGSTVSLIGATSPPSFALEAFVHCEGESRFRRLCPAFLYSPASSNLLEVEAVITNHLVIRGSYRSLSLIVYGNTAEDLGQFNIEVDLDSSLANLVSSPCEGKLVDLPTAFCSSYLPFEESTSFKLLSHFSLELDLSSEMKGFIQLLLKICKVSIYKDRLFDISNPVVSAVSSYIGNTTSGLLIGKLPNKQSICVQEKDRQQVINALVSAKTELLELHNLVMSSGAAGSLQMEIGNDSDLESLTSKYLVDLYNQIFPSDKKIPEFLLQNKVSIQLGIAILLCSTRESCSHFVNIGGLMQIIDMINSEIHKSPAILLTLLVTIEHATRYGIGCEGFLGWWPRDFGSVPVDNSVGYSNLLAILLGTRRHDIASLATVVLHRLRFYEIASRYESSVLSVITSTSNGSWIASDGSKSLLKIADLLKSLLKSLRFHCFMEDIFGPEFRRRPNFDQAEGMLSYKATIDYITYSKFNFATQDIDTNILFLLKERGFVPLSAALLSCPTLRSEDSTLDIFVEIVSSIQLILLSLLQCRSGLTFLLLQPEATATLVLSLKGDDEFNKWECLTLRHAANLISKGFFCRPEEISKIVELHLRVVHLIDRLLASTIHSEEQFWILWDLCAISRSDSGSQALLLVGFFPEAISVLLECLSTVKDSEVIAATIGHSPSNVVIFHCVAEIFEALVTDSAASSLNCWMEHAMDLHKALHSSSPGSNRKDAPTRLLEWIDAGIVYNRNGAVGLLRYAAVLASGGDAHLSSANILVSDSMDVENVVGETVSSPDSQILDNLLGKFVSDKYFEGVSLRTTSLVQLTTAFRILAFISENSAVASSLYEEGAVSLIYVVLVNCKYMLERSSNSYGYLVDEGAECTSTSDLLLERNIEDSLIDLLIPSLLFLINIVQKIQDAKDQYKNTKLLNALLKLHREVSPKVVASATELSLPFPSLAVGLHVVCRLIVSALASWPIFGWAPGLFLCLFESVHATQSLALGPKDVCSLFCLLGDLLPMEDIWLWRNGVPALSALRSVSVGTVLDSSGESYVDWYLKPEYQAALLVRMTQQSEKIAQIILTFSNTVLDVLQDILRVLIVRIACRKTEFANSLIGPLVSWVDAQITDSSISDITIFKVYRCMNFISGLMEHPHTQLLLSNEKIVRMLCKLLERCWEVWNVDGNFISENRFLGNNTINVRSWILPALRSLSYLFHFSSTADESISDEVIVKCVPLDIHSSILLQLLKLCWVLPVGVELLGCLFALKGVIFINRDADSQAYIFRKIMSVYQENQGCEIGIVDESNRVWSSAPFLTCLRKLLQSLQLKDDGCFFVLEAVHTLSVAAITLCCENICSEALNFLKFLFGIPYKVDDTSLLEEGLKDLHELIDLLKAGVDADEISVSQYKDGTLFKVIKSVEELLLQLQSIGHLESEGDAYTRICPDSRSHSSVVESILRSSDVVDVWKSIQLSEKAEEILLGSHLETFSWDCPDTPPDKVLVSSQPLKRKLSSTEGSNRRGRENPGSETVASNVFTRGMATASISSGPSRRDTFRQRKPNTSRPPSMHVDDYVARERNIDGVSSSSNVVGSNQRGGLTSGRPPSIHVDEFMARQRERQNSMVATTGDSMQVENTPADNGSMLEKSDSSRKLRADLDDDYEINIIFDEESESDERLPFPQLDDSIRNPLVTGESPPASIVEESEGDVRGSSPSEIPSRASIHPSEATSTKEVSVSLEKDHSRADTKKTLFQEQSDESKYSSPSNGSKGTDANPHTVSNGFTSTLYGSSTPVPAAQRSLDARSTPPTSSLSGNPPKALSSTSSISRGYYDQKVPLNQPPPPPMPPPHVSPLLTRNLEQGQNLSTPYSQTGRDFPPPLPSGYPQLSYDAISTNTVASAHLQTETAVAAGSTYSTTLSANQSVRDSKFSWTTNQVGSPMHEQYTSGKPLRPPPPLPPMPPPYSSSSVGQALVTSSGSQTSYSSNLAHLPSNTLSEVRLGILSAGSPSFSLSQFASPMVVARPAPSPGSLLSSPTQNQNMHCLSAPVLSPLSSHQSIQPRAPPPPPPQLPRPPHLSQHIRPLLQVSQAQPEQIVVFPRNPIQVQVPQSQVPQQLQAPQFQVFYQTQQQEIPRIVQPSLEQSHPSNPQIQSDDTSQQQDSSMTLLHFLSSPESIQSLLNDRERLCELLEREPKLMQMLQDHLGQ